VAFARVHCKEFEVRNEWQKQNIIAISMFFLFLLNSYGISAANALEKITVTGDGSNNSGVWVRSLQPPEANGVWGRSPQRWGDFPVFIKKNNAFYEYIGLNFCLETCYWSKSSA